MSILTKRKQKTIGKLLAASWYDLTFGIKDPTIEDIETIAVVIGNFAEIAVEIGGPKMAKTVADLYDDLHNQLGGAEE